MIYEVRRTIEREARLRSNRITEWASQWRRLRAASFGTYLAAGNVAYLVLLGSEIAQSRYPSSARMIHASGLALAFTALLVCQIVRFSDRQTAKIARWLSLAA